MGDVKRWVNAGGLWDPAGSITRVGVAQRNPNAGGKIGQLEAQQQNKAINIHNTLDPGGIQREQTTGVKGSSDPLTGKPTVLTAGNPNAPGSIFNMGNGQLQPLNSSLGVPTNGVSTNGLQQPQGYFNPQGGTPNFGMQGSGPDWSSIIAKALQGPAKQTTGQGMPVGPRFRV